MPSASFMYFSAFVLFLFFLFLNNHFTWGQNYFLFFLYTHKKSVLHLYLSKKHILFSFPSAKFISLFQNFYQKHILLFLCSHFLSSLLFSNSFVKILALWQMDFGKGTSLALWLLWETSFFPPVCGSCLHFKDMIRFLTSRKERM